MKTAKAIANPISFRLASDSNYTITCVSNAAFTQRATISESGGPLGIFEGVGEGVQMQLTTGGDSLQGATRSGNTISIYFEVDPGSGFQPSTITVNTTATTPTGTITTIATEDSIDNDNNDTTMTIVQQSL